MLGLFIMLVGACFVCPIIVIHRCSIPSKLIWGRGIIIISVGTYFAILWLTSFPNDWPSLKEHFMYASTSLFISIICTTIIYKLKRKAEIRDYYRQKEIEETLAKFRAHGGPKRPKGDGYVAQPSWKRSGVGLGSGTPTDTITKQGQGYHGMPLP